MLVGCYTLHLYCDIRGCSKNSDTGYHCPAQYTGETMTECVKAAIADGWRIDRRSGSVRGASHFCKAHNRKADRQGLRLIKH